MKSINILASMHTIHNDNPYVMPITLSISSPGGLCSVGQTIVDHMIHSEESFFTVSQGMTASMAAWIWFCGFPRYINTSGDIVVHQASKHYKSVAADAASMEKSLQRLHDINTQMLRTIQYTTNATFYK